MSFYAGRLRSKLGLRRAEEGDVALAQELLGSMHSSGADFTNTFADLTRSVESGELLDLSVQGGSAVQPWQAKWRVRLGREPAEKAEVMALMRSANPVVIPRNHRVEEALAAAGEGILRRCTACSQCWRGRLRRGRRMRRIGGADGRRRAVPNVLWDVRGRGRKLEGET